MLREVETSKVAIGMYVAELDRPWLETPFPVQGFYIRSADDINRLRSCCHSVFVDPRRFDYRLSSRAGGRDATRAPSVPEPEVVYEDAGSVEDELPAASDALSVSNDVFEQLWSALSQKRRVSLDQVRAAVDPLVESILRNKDALAALMRVQRADRHTHEHCMALAVWAALMGRQLGFPPAEVKTLSLGCSLVDIGKVRLPRELLECEERMSKAERVLLRSHVEYSLEMLAEMGDASDAVIATVRFHHERMDGSGYPHNLEGPDIPLYARIAAIVDSYDAMISPRRAAAARSSFEAMMELQDLSPQKYQAELVEQFAQVIGIFPSGALVELSSGEVAVVFSQNTGRRLRPKVLVILDAHKRRRDRLVLVDLNGEGTTSLRIARELPRGEHGVDAREYFL
ncbi:MAG: HD-GYP domain-containing protein [Pseudomonadota bacterium]